MTDAPFTISIPSDRAATPIQHASQMHQEIVPGSGLQRWMVPDRTKQDDSRWKLIAKKARAQAHVAQAAIDRSIAAQAEADKAKQQAIFHAYNAIKDAEVHPSVAASAMGLSTIFCSHSMKKNAKEHYISNTRLEQLITLIKAVIQVKDARLAPKQKNQSQ